MGSDEILRMTVGEYENRLTHSYLLGGVGQLEGLPGHLRGRAGAAFAKGLDEKAHWFRELAEQFERDAKAARKAYIEAGKELDEAWGEEPGSTLPAEGKGSR